MCQFVRDGAGVSLRDFPDTSILPYLNAAKDDLWSYIITAIKSKYNWDTWRVKT